MKGASNTDSSGATGEIENSGGNLQFSGGNLNGQTAVYKGGNPPTISFIDDNGESSSSASSVNDRLNASQKQRRSPAQARLRLERFVRSKPSCCRPL